MIGIVDRIEGEFFVIEIDGITKDIHKSQVNENVSINDTVELINGIWTSNEKITEERSKQIKTLMDQLWED